MFKDMFEELSGSDQENFKRIVNLLLAHTFILQEQYRPEDNMRKTNADYLFVERNFELLQDYLQYSGFSLERDSNYGVISLRSNYDFNRQKFDKLTTLMLYVIRLVYEEQREALSLSEIIFITTGELIHKMISLGVIQKKPADRDLRDSLRKLSRFCIVEKLEGKWEDADTRFLIYPTVLFIIANERISNMYSLIESPSEEAEEDFLKEQE